MQTNERRHWLLAAVTGAVGVYTHYYFGLLIVLVVAAFVLSTIPPTRDARAFRYHQWIALGVAGLGILPAVALWYRDVQGEWGFASQAGFGVPEFGFSYYSVFTGYTLGPSLRELHVMTTVEALTSALPWLLLTAVPALALVVIGWRRITGPMLPRMIVFLVAVAPVALVGIVSLVAPFGFNIRHTVWVFIPIFAVMGLAVNDDRTVVKILFGLVVLTSLIAIGNRHLNDDHRNEDVAAVAEDIAGSGRPVFVISGYMTEPVEHYLDGSEEVRALPDIGTDGSGLEEALAEIGTSGDYWLVVSRTFHGDPDGILLEELGAALTPAGSHAGVDLYRGVSR